MDYSFNDNHCEILCGDYAVEQLPHRGREDNVDPRRSLILEGQSHIITRPTVIQVVNGSFMDDMNLRTIMTIETSFLD
jgi:hypothetical protein